MSRQLFPRRAALIAAVFLIFFTALPIPAAARDRLEVGDVRSTFIGHEWGQGNHAFLFAEDGSFHYRNTKKGTSFGGSYEMDGEGTICATNDSSAPHPGRKTCFTFYRSGSGYEYYHDRSGKYWPARLK